MRLYITLTSDHVADFRSVPFSDLGDQAAKKKKKERKKKKKERNTGKI